MLLLGLCAIWLQTKRRPVGEIRSLTTRALPTWGVQEQKNWTEAQKVWKTVTQGMTSPQNFHPVPLAVSLEAPPGSQWRHSQVKGQETPLHIAFPGSSVVERLQFYAAAAWPCLGIEGIFTRSCLGLRLGGLGLFERDRSRPLLIG